MTQPTLDIFTGSKNLNRVFREQHQYNIKFTEFNLPFSQDSGNIAVNWKGKTRVIVVQGAHDGTGFDGSTQENKLSDFIFEMEQWVSGATGTANVQKSQIYTDSFGVSYTVKCFDWTWSRSFSDPNRINWSLLLKVVLT